MQQEHKDRITEFPLLSVIIPAFNEAALLEPNVGEIVNHLRMLENEYRWELLIIDDGSTDGTAEIADALASRAPNVSALHHPRNFGLGQALRFGFANTRGDFVVTMDADLSYGVGHIDELLHKLVSDKAKIVIASPYMKGGTIVNVPFFRRIASVLANKFLKLFVRRNLSTLTSLMRAYDGPFIRSLDLRAMKMDAMPETLYKSMVVRATIDEIPGRLDWEPHQKYGSRTSSMRLTRQVISTILSGFVFRPLFFFVMPGLLIGVFALYVDFWMFVHFFDGVSEMREATGSVDLTEVFAVVYKKFPHTFLIGLLATMLSLQFLGLGVLAQQSKRYFEDLYHQAWSHARRVDVSRTRVDE